MSNETQPIKEYSSDEQRIIQQRNGQMETLPPPETCSACGGAMLVGDIDVRYSHCSNTKCQLMGLSRSSGIKLDKQPPQPITVAELSKCMSCGEQLILRNETLMCVNNGCQLRGIPHSIALPRPPQPDRTYGIASAERIASQRDDSSLVAWLAICAGLVMFALLFTSASSIDCRVAALEGRAGLLETNTTGLRIDMLRAGQLFQQEQYVDGVLTTNIIQSRSDIAAIINTLRAAVQPKQSANEPTNTSVKK